eukprot:gene19115-922_t
MSHPECDIWIPIPDFLGPRWDKCPTQSETIERTFLTKNQRRKFERIVHGGVVTLRSELLYKRASGLRFSAIGPTFLETQLDEIQSILLVESCNDVTTENISGTSWAKSPTINVLRIRPQQITHGSLDIPMAYYISSSQFMRKWSTRSSRMRVNIPPRVMLDLLWRLYSLLMPSGSPTNAPHYLSTLSRLYVPKKGKPEAS